MKHYRDRTKPLAFECTTCGAHRFMSVIKWMRKKRPDLMCCQVMREFRKLKGNEKGQPYFVMQKFRMPEIDQIHYSPAGAPLFSEQRGKSWTKEYHEYWAPYNQTAQIALGRDKEKN